MLLGIKSKTTGLMHPPEPEKYKASPFVLFWFAVGVFLLPIDWIYGIRVFGEYSIMSSFYVFFPLVFCLFPFIILKRQAKPLAPELRWFIILMSISLFLSLLFNVPDILASNLKNRAGINKVITTLITFYFSAGLLVVVSTLAQDRNFIRKAIIKPLLFSFPLVLLVSMIEVIGWYVPLAGRVYVGISEILRSGYPFLESSAEHARMRGVSGEPPSAAIFLAYSLIWSYYLALNAKNIGRHGISSKLFFWINCVLLFLTKARTSHIFFLGFIASRIFISLNFLSAPKKEFRSVSFKMPLFLLIGFFIFCLLAHNNYIIAHVTNGDSISNLSRYASIYTAISLFYDSPLVGHGPGQYGFMAFAKMPDWGWRSWEIKSWFTDLQRGWPPIFSLPARLAAELGIIGIFAWYLPLLEFSRRLLHAIRKEYQRLERLPALGITLFLGMTYVLLQGVALDSFRFFELWIMIGITSAYLNNENPEAFYLRDPLEEKNRHSRLTR